MAAKCLANTHKLARAQKCQLIMHFIQSIFHNDQLLYSIKFYAQETIASLMTRPSILLNAQETVQQFVSLAIHFVAVT